MKGARRKGDATGAWRERLGAAVSQAVGRRGGRRTDTEKLKSDGNVESLIDLLLGGDGAAADAARDALRELTDARCARGLLQAVRDGRADANHAGLVELLTLAGSRAAGPAAEAYLDGNERSRELSARILERIGEPAVAPLLELLRGGARPVDDHVAALAARLGPEALASLLDAVQRGGATGPETEILVRIGFPGLEPQLASLDRAGSSRVEAMATICRRIGAPAVEHLVCLLGADAPRIREGAGAVLSEQLDVVLPTLLRIADGSLDVGEKARCQVIGLLQEAPFERTRGALLQALRSRRAAVNRAARCALAAGGEQAVDALTEIAGNGQAQERAIAIETLGDIKHPDCLGLLIGLLEDRDSAVRQAAISAVSQYGESASGPLSEALASGSYWVRKAAAEILRKQSR